MLKILLIIFYLLPIRAFGIEFGFLIIPPENGIPIAQAIGKYLNSGSREWEGGHLAMYFKIRNVLTTFDGNQEISGEKGIFGIPVDLNDPNLLNTTWGKNLSRAAYIPLGTAKDNLISRYWVAASLVRVMAKSAYNYFLNCVTFVNCSLDMLVPEFGNVSLFDWNHSWYANSALNFEQLKATKQPSHSRLVALPNSEGRFNVLLPEGRVSWGHDWTSAEVFAFVLLPKGVSPGEIDLALTFEGNAITPTSIEPLGNPENFTEDFSRYGLIDKPEILEEPHSQNWVHKNRTQSFFDRMGWGHDDYYDFPDFSPGDQIPEVVKYSFYVKGLRPNQANLIEFFWEQNRTSYFNSAYRIPLGQPFVIDLIVSD